MNYYVYSWIAISIRSHLTYRYGIVNGTANQTDNSLQVNKTSVTFKPGQKHMHLRIELFNDDVINGDGTFFIVIGSLDPTAMTSSTCTKFVVSQKGK